MVHVSNFFLPSQKKTCVSLHEVMTAGRCDPKNAQHYVLGKPYYLVINGIAPILVDGMV